MRFITYWFEDHSDLGFCLIEGPDKEAVEAAHRAAHGLDARGIRDAIRGWL